MRPSLTLFVVAGMLCAAFVACSRGAAGLSDQDKAAIRKVVDDATKMSVAAKGNYKDFVNLYYAEDATLLMANTPAVQGRAAIQAVYASVPPMSEFKLDIVEVDGYADVAHVRGNYAMTLTPPGAAPVSDKGKYVEIWKKQADGTWKAKYDSWSSDLPVPGLTLPTGAMAANASAEVKKLGDIIGRWQYTGTVQEEPGKPASPLSVGLDCQWFAGGLQVVCREDLTIGTRSVQQFGTYSYNAATKTYGTYAIGMGDAEPGKLTITPGTWVFEGTETEANGKPAKTRLTLMNITPTGGDWKIEVSVAGGAWTQTGSGKYSKTT